MNYFYVHVRYLQPVSTGKLSTGHLIRAKNEQDALRIAKKHGIAFPFNSPFVKFRKIYKKLYENRTFDEALIERRRKGIGGKIWYEDKNGKLQYETN